MSNVQNWRDLKAGRELDAEVARRLGWTVKIVDVAPENHIFELRAPDGRFVWSQSTLKGEMAAWSRVPAYSTDIRAALGLVPDDVVITMDRTSVAWSAAFYVDGVQHYGQAPRDSLPLAIVRAWLAYMDAQEAADE